eukprot:GSA120T00014700001.1
MLRGAAPHLPVDGPAPAARSSSRERDCCGVAEGIRVPRSGEINGAQHINGARDSFFSASEVVAESGRSSFSEKVSASMENKRRETITRRPEKEAAGAPALLNTKENRFEILLQKEHEEDHGDQHQRTTSRFCSTSENEGTASDAFGTAETSRDGAVVGRRVKKQAKSAENRTRNVVKRTESAMPPGKSSRTPIIGAQQQDVSDEKNAFSITITGRDGQPFSDTKSSGSRFNKDLKEWVQGGKLKAMPSCQALFANKSTRARAHLYRALGRDWLRRRGPQFLNYELEALRGVLWQHMAGTRRTPFLPPWLMQKDGSATW